jgi:hypothetical protein
MGGAEHRVPTEHHALTGSAADRYGVRSMLARLSGAAVPGGSRSLGHNESRHEAALGTHHLRCCLARRRAHRPKPPGRRSAPRPGHVAHEVSWPLPTPNASEGETYRELGP